MASFNLVTEQRTYAFTLATAAGVDQVARDAVAAVRQVPVPTVQGQVLTAGANGTYGFSASVAGVDQAARNAATAAQNEVDALEALVNNRTVAKPYPQHQVIKWDAARAGADKYDARDTGTYVYARYYGPTDPATVGRTINTLDEWAVTP